MGEYLDWAKPYVKHKDVMRKQIQNMEEKEEGKLVVTKLNSSEEYLEVGSKNLSTINLETECDQLWLVCDNTKDKVNELAENWNSLATNPKLRFIFVNLKSGSKWLLNPSTHAAIADETKLKKSLEAIQKNS